MFLKIIPIMTFLKKNDIFENKKVMVVKNQIN